MVSERLRSREQFTGLLDQLRRPEVQGTLGKAIMGLLIVDIAVTGAVAARRLDRHPSRPALELVAACGKAVHECVVVTSPEIPGSDSYKQPVIIKKEPTPKPTPTSQPSQKPQSPTPTSTPKPTASRPALPQSRAHSMVVSPLAVNAEGVDISFPNCSVPIPSDLDFGIVGVNHGKNFTANNCLADQAGHFNHLMLYANTGYPGVQAAKEYQNSPRHCAVRDNLCWAYNYGYNAGQYTANYANSQGIRADTWYLDVEWANSWTSSMTENRSSLQGQADAIRKYAKARKVGVYSNAKAWSDLTGSWQNGWSNWVASGDDTATEALTACNQNFTGAPTELVQYVTDLDHDIVCPARPDQN